MTEAVPEQPKLAVVILNWNGWRDTVDCLDSLLMSEYEDICVVVVDNGSTDDSVLRILEWAQSPPCESVQSVAAGECPRAWGSVLHFASSDEALADAEARLECCQDTNLVVIENGANVGFSAGNNLGLRYVLAQSTVDYVLVLNNDMVVKPRALSTLVAALEQRPEAGVAGGKIFYYHDPSRIWFGGGRISWLHGGGIYLSRDKLEEHSGPSGTAREVTFLSGAAWLIRVGALRMAGLLPEAYFMGGEESEFSVRMRRQGFRLLYVPQAELLHKVGRSHDKSHTRATSSDRFDRRSATYAYSSPRHLYNWYRYKLLFQRRNLAAWAYRIWYVSFLMYLAASAAGMTPASRRIHHDIRGRLLRAVVRDHARYDCVTLEHLQSFEQELADGQ